MADQTKQSILSGQGNTQIIGVLMASSSLKYGEGMRKLRA